MDKLPIEIQSYIYTLDSTYHELYKSCLYELSHCFYCKSDNNTDFEFQFCSDNVCRRECYSCFDYDYSYDIYEDDGYDSFS